MAISTKDFTPNNQLDDEQRSILLKINIEFPEFAKMIDELLPESQQKNACMENLLAAKFFATQSVTHGKDAVGFIPAPKPVAPKMETMKADPIMTGATVTVSNVPETTGEPEVAESGKTNAELMYAAELAKAERALQEEFAKPVVEAEPPVNFETKQEEVPQTQTTVVEEDAEKAAF